MLPSTLLLAQVPLPPLALIEQPLFDDALPDVAAAASSALQGSPMRAAVKPGMRVAVGVGSRGIANLPVLVSSVVAWLKDLGAEPFVVPAMGSHGRATAEGQKELLAELGITEERVRCPLVSSMDVVEVGRLASGFAVYMDRNAFTADGIFVINRVKPHTAFRGRHESGIVKIVTIGLGKQRGADSCHALGYGHFPSLLPEMAALCMEKANVIGALAVVENSLDKTCLVEAVPANAMFERDAALLRLAWEKMPSLPFDALDVLIVDMIGKNIAGAGMDSNVVGRYPSLAMIGGPEITVVGLLDISPESHGNGHGMGFADIVTHRLRDKLDMEASYVNSLTSTTLRCCALPCALESDREVFRAAAKVCHQPALDKIRFVRIQNTLNVRCLRVSPALIPETLGKGCVLLAEPEMPRFSVAGELTDLHQWQE
jgi:hypothetical protein